MTQETEIMNEVARMEAHFHQGLQIATRLKKKLGLSAATNPSARKGLSEDEKAAITGKRKKNILKKAV